MADLDDGTVNRLNAEVRRQREKFGDDDVDPIEGDTPELVLADAAIALRCYEKMRKCRSEAQTRRAERSDSPKARG